MTKTVEESLAPHVSIIMPCYNEEKYIAGAIESLLDEWVLKNCELIVVDGKSEDRTKQIIQALAERIENQGQKWPFLKILNNEARIQASGLNKGIEEARGEIIVRADAHCLYPEGYVKRCVDILLKREKEGVANVGGYIRPIGKTITELAVALALKSPVGVGDSAWHLGKKSGFVDTVYLGTFRRETLKETGLYDPEAHPNEDAELNLRLIKRGGKIYLDRSLGVYYFVRDSLDKLARQYYFYGQGRAFTTWKHGRLTSWRQLAPVAVLMGIAAGVGAGFFWRPLWLIPAGYLLVLAAGAVMAFRQEAKEAKHKAKVTKEETNEMDKKLEAKLAGVNRLADRSFTEKIVLFGLIMASFATIHFCWAAGFISRFLKLCLRKKP